MCGIVGVQGRLRDPLKSLNLACAAMLHRGPDDIGQWMCEASNLYLGHVRLAIQDLSSAGHQPMLSFDGKVVMVFNGEIYNYKELRRTLIQQGIQFKSETDSEVLVNLFALEGPACFAKLNGIFAVAFWHKEQQKLTLVRDRFGAKPLYLAENKDGVYFASEVKSLVRSGWVQPDLDVDVLFRHLCYVWAPGQKSILKGINKLAPGKVVEYQNGEKIAEWSYAKMTYSSNINMNEKAAIAHTAEVVEQAVKRQMVSDAPLGAFLSGGLDSSAIVAFASREVQTHALQCFTIEVDEKKEHSEGFYRDIHYAKAVAKHLGVDLKSIKVDASIMQRLPEMLYYLDEPTADPAALLTMMIAELAREQGIKVLLSGTGGDDIFTGYRRHYAVSKEPYWTWMNPSILKMLRGMALKWPSNSDLMRRINKLMRYCHWQNPQRLMSYFFWQDPSVVLGLLNPQVAATLNVNALYDPFLESLSDLDANTHPINAMLHLEQRHFLADHNLNYADKIGMAKGIEIRVPLLDMDLVQWANQLPPSYKQNHNVGKWIFKKAMEPYLPKDVIYRPKTGFGTPMRTWMRQSLGAMKKDLLSYESLHKRGLFNPMAVSQLVEQDKAGKIDASYTLFSVMCIESWCRQYLDGQYAVSLNTTPFLSETAISPSRRIIV